MKEGSQGALTQNGDGAGLAMSGRGASAGRLEFRSQKVAYPYFVVAALLFVLQIVFGLIIAAQYVWPSFLADSLPFNIARESHLNLMIFWLLLGLMGASYYLIPSETRSELFSVRLAYLQLAVMLVAGVGTLLSFWLLRQSLGKPFTESPMPWPLLIALGVVLFLINVGISVYRSHRWTAISVVLFGGMTGMALLYLIDMVFFPNLTVDYYWWWWIIHLWVEGTWELVASAILAYLLISLTGVSRGRMARWLYLEVALTMFTGIVGIGHHYYWIGTPAYWLTWGAVFSALEPIPIALMAVDAFSSMKERHGGQGNRVTWYLIGGSAIGHFLGAGLWGFGQTLPQVNQWTHGTLITASHGHFAFAGAFALLVLAAMYYIVPQVRGVRVLREGRGMLAFWLTSSGLLAIVLAFTIAGVVQVYLYRMVGLDFMVVRTQYVSFWMFWVWLSGLVLFLPGTMLYAWDILFPREAVESVSRSAAAPLPNV